MDNKKINAKVLLKDKDNYLDVIKYISKLALIDNLEVVESDTAFDNNSVVLTFNSMIVAIPLDSMVDSKAEKERIEKEISRLKSEIERSEKMLANAGFVAIFSNVTIPVNDPLSI